MRKFTMAACATGLSAQALTGGSNPDFDTIVDNTAFRDHPADLIWDGTGTNVQFGGQRVREVIPGRTLSLTSHAQGSAAPSASGADAAVPRC